MPILGLKVPGPSKPAHFSLEPLIRPNILALQPYRCARDDYSAGVLLDANENSLGAAFIAGASDAPDASAQPNGSAKTQTNGSSTSSNGASAADNATRSTGASSESIAADTLSLLSPGELLELNRYPSPTHDELKCRIAEYRGVPDENWVFLGVGSDEVIDMLYRVLCVPGKDRVMTLPPTYGMYKVTANVNDVGVLEVPLITEGGAFQMDEQAMDAAFEANPDLKMLFICSPGNPTGTLIPLDAIKRVLDNPKFRGVVVVDEAYIDFAGTEHSAAYLVNEYANVCVTQTLSKGFGLAAIRLGYLLASPPLIQILTNTKAPYNVSVPTASIASQAVSPSGLSAMERTVKTLTSNRSFLISELEQIPAVGRIIGGNHANFVLCEILDAPKEAGGKPCNERAVAVYKEMAEHRGVVVRFRGHEIGCKGCFRVTVGTREECEVLIKQLKELLA